MGERWIPIPGYEGRYEVSDLGNVRSLARISVRSNGRPLPVRERILKPTAHYRSGHLRVFLEGKCIEVHRLVAAAFLGPRPDGLEVCHWDDNPRNNHVSNLRYGTFSDNMRDRVRNGIHPQVVKEFCPSGHPYSGDNLRICRTGAGGVGRLCRECCRARSRESMRKWRERRRAGSC